MNEEITSEGTYDKWNTFLVIYDIDIQVIGISIDIDIQERL